MDPPQQYELSAVDTTGSQYTVERTGHDENFRPEYEARDVTGETLFRTTHQCYTEKDEFPFVTDDGTEICRVVATGAWNIAGDYVLTDTQTDQPLVILDKELSLLQDTWRIRDADDRSLLATIDSRGALISLGRKLLPIGQRIPHEYTVTSDTDEPIGSIDADPAIVDQTNYEISLTDTGVIPQETVLITAIVIDALRGNYR